MTQAQAVINVLPVVSQVTQIYFTVILNDNSLNQCTITASSIFYGNALLTGVNTFIPQDNKPLAIGVTATFNSVTYFAILYTKAIYPQSTPDNFARIVQKIPLGIFTDISPVTLIGQIFGAKANMLSDYYQTYFNVQNQVYSNQYSPQLEYEYNGTIGLLSTSIYPEQLFQLLASLNIVALNTYDLELFISKYIYYRLGTASAVYIDDHVDFIDTFWHLDSVDLSILGVTTMLAPDSLTPILKDAAWTIYNSGAFTANFKQEIANLIIRVSRCDFGNPVTFSNIVNPVLDAFELIGPTYQNDPRLTFNKCLDYIGDAAYPLNIIGYRKIIA